MSKNIIKKNSRKATEPTPILDTARCSLKPVRPRKKNLCFYHTNTEIARPKDTVTLSMIQNFKNNKYIDAAHAEKILKICYANEATPSDMLNLKKRQSISQNIRTVKERNHQKRIQNSKTNEILQKLLKTLKNELECEHKWPSNLETEDVPDRTQILPCTRSKRNNPSISEPLSKPFEVSTDSRKSKDGKEAQSENAHLKMPEVQLDVTHYRFGNQPQRVRTDKNVNNSYIESVFPKQPSPEFRNESSEKFLHFKEKITSDMLQINPVEISYKMAVDVMKLGVHENGPEVSMGTAFNGSLIDAEQSSTMKDSGFDDSNLQEDVVESFKTVDVLQTSSSPMEHSVAERFQNIIQSKRSSFLNKVVFEDAIEVESVVQNAVESVVQNAQDKEKKRSEREIQPSTATDAANQVTTAVKKFEQIIALRKMKKNDETYNKDLETLIRVQKSNFDVTFIVRKLTTPGELKLFCQERVMKESKIFRYIETGGKVRLIRVKAELVKDLYGHQEFSFNEDLTSVSYLNDSTADTFSVQIVDSKKLDLMPARDIVVMEDFIDGNKFEVKKV